MGAAPGDGVDDDVGVFGGEGLGVAVGANEAGALVARSDPGAGEFFVFADDDEFALGKATGVEQVGWCGGDNAYGVEACVDEFDEVNALFFDPVAACEAQVARAGGEHADDVLRRKGLAIAVGQRQEGTLGREALGGAQAGLGEEFDDGGLARAVGDGEAQGGGFCAE